MDQKCEYHESISDLDDYKSLILKELSVRYFWSELSGNCHIMTPVLDQLSTHYQNQFLIYSINIDRNKDLRQYSEITKIPTTQIYFDDKLEENIIGIVSLNKLIKKLISY